MQFHHTRLAGVVEISLDTMTDERGFFARSWCQQEFRARGLNSNLAQCNISFNIHKGTLRGMHYQVPAFPEAKLVRCTKGAIYDVVVDLRPGSSTFTQWIGVRLSAADHSMVYVPEGCAHGFLTLEDEAEIFYQMSEFFHPESARGVRWNDPQFKIEWPGEVKVISERDCSYPDFRR